VHNVFKGIVVGFIGLVIWVAASIPAGIDAAFGATTPPFIEAFITLGFVLMILGPIVYIVVLPVAGWVKRRRARRDVRASPSSP